MPTSIGLRGENNSRRFGSASETSFSFQIPTAAPGDDYLLDYDDDFFKGAGDILATPAPSRSTLEPLTINDLTPRPSNATWASLKSSPQKIQSRSQVTDPQGSPARASFRNQHGRPKPNSIAQLIATNSVPQSPAGERIESLKAQVNLLTDDFEVVQELIQRESPKEPVLKKYNSHRREAAVQRKDPAKHTVLLAGGITKARQQRGVKSSSIAPNAAAAVIKQTFESQKVLPNAPEPEFIISPDSSVGSDVLGSPQIRNLNLSTTHGMSGADAMSFDGLDQNHEGEAAQPVLESRVESAVVDVSPLTLSQLSPQKCNIRGSSSVYDDAGAGAVESASTGAFRASPKRPVSEVHPGETESGRAHKKSKPDPAQHTSSNPSTSSRKRALETRKRIKRLSTSSSRRKVNIIASKVQAKPPAAMRKANKLGSMSSQKVDGRGPGSNATRDPNGVKSTRASNQLQNFEEPDLKNRGGRGKIISASSSSQVLRPASTERAHSRLNSKSTSRSGPTGSKLNILHATIPVGFNFRVDARLEARKGAAVGGSGREKDANSQNLRHQSHQQPIQHHQQQQHTLRSSSRNTVQHGESNSVTGMGRSANLFQSKSYQPVVPIPINFQTESRVKERHKFDVRMKEKEQREHEEREARRKQQEEEEVREVRELRRRAIPKAHQVPEWYRDAPKKERDR